MVQRTQVALGMDICAQRIKQTRIRSADAVAGFGLEGGFGGLQYVLAPWTTQTSTTQWRLILDYCLYETGSIATFYVGITRSLTAR
jgi:hypothetical protein